MIVQLAGLPGTGKSTLAAALLPRLGPHALMLDKDRIRALLFGPHHVEYRQEQDDLCVALLHQAAAYHLGRHPDGTVILDGRTCSRRYQVADVERLAQQTGHLLRIIECTCAEVTVRQRLTYDTTARTHPAANRDFGLYLRLKATADPIAVPALRLSTDIPIGECIRRALTYLTTDAVHATADAEEPS
ncbi:AAA family ATPase [Dactylosporangium darangshiense]|uniref:ATP-binding protein n=1 Tax=Dactylosporangium darangshiense TaxID=579108 RepID=A0ABP8DIG5_9ACTN